MDDIRPASEASGANRVLRLPLAAAAGVVRAVGRAASGAWGFAGSVLSIPRLKLGTAELHVEAHRNDGNDAAIVLVHGFGACNRTWGDLPALLKREPAVDGWDIYSVGYDTAFIPDVRGLWSADPDIATLATYVRSRLRLEPLGRYRAVALVAHSMGGLVVQRALVDDPALVARTSHVLLYGSPSGGLVKARVGAFLKVQLRDMAMGSDFLTDLRHRWDEQFGERRPFELWAVAGDRDVFVPASTSLGPFPPEAQVVIPGNHLEICMVRDPEDLTLRVLVDAVAGTDTPGGPLNAARVAVERRDFHRAIDLLAPHAGDLDDRHLVELALALDETGDREAAIEVLRAHATGTDARGTLAGRLKRAWLADGTRREAEEALELYREAYQEAVQRTDHAQAAYLGINVAFLELAYVGDRAAAATTAEDVLTHCAEDHDDRWRAATEAEAHLYLGDRAEALACYRRAAAGATSARAVTSTFQQAAWVASEIDDDRLADELAALYHGVGEPDRGPRPAASAHRPGGLG